MTATDRPHSFYLVLSHQRHYLLLSHSFPSTLISFPSLLSPPKRPRFGRRGGGRGSWRREGLPQRPPAHGWAEAAHPQGRGTAATADARATSGARVARRRLARRGTAGARAAQRPPATKGARGRRGGAPQAPKRTGPPTPPTRFFYC